MDKTKKTKERQYSCGSQHYALIANTIVFVSIMSIQKNAQGKMVYTITGSGMNLLHLSIQFVVGEEEHWLFNSLDELYASPLWKANPLLAINKKKKP